MEKSDSNYPPPKKEQERSRQSTNTNISQQEDPNLIKIHADSDKN